MHPSQVVLPGSSTPISETQLDCSLQGVSLIVPATKGVAFFLTCLLEGSPGLFARLRALSGDAMQAPLGRKSNRSGAKRVGFSEPSWGGKRQREQVELLISTVADHGLTHSGVTTSLWSRETIHSHSFH